MRVRQNKIEKCMMMTAKSMLSKRPVLRITKVLFLPFLYTGCSESLAHISSSHISLNMNGSKIKLRRFKANHIKFFCKAVGLKFFVSFYVVKSDIQCQRLRKNLVYCAVKISKKRKNNITCLEMSLSL